MRLAIVRDYIPTKSFAFCPVCGSPLDKCETRPMLAIPEDLERFLCFRCEREHGGELYAVVDLWRTTWDWMRSTKRRGEPLEDFLLQNLSSSLRYQLLHPIDPNGVVLHILSSDKYILFECATLTEATKCLREHLAEKARGRPKNRIAIRQLLDASKERWPHENWLEFETALLA